MPLTLDAYHCEDKPRIPQLDFMKGQNQNSVGSVSLECYDCGVRRDQDPGFPACTAPGG